MNSVDLFVGPCRQLLTCQGRIPKRKGQLSEVGCIEGGCIASYQNRIVFVGPEKAFHQDFQLEQEAECIDASHLIALPGFVDAHTHLPFAGTREEEFVLRLAGLTYQQLAERGMGIQTSVNATRQASKDQLLSLVLSRLDSMLLHGTTTTEAKSGYGLNLKDEIKQLETLKEANELHPVDIVPTFMGAHEIPTEFKGRKDDYIELLIQEIIPRVKGEHLAEFFDVFCEEDVYSVEESRRLIRAAREAGFKIRIHADEFTPLGGAQLAAEQGASSADHLINITEEGIQALSQSETAATLLPAVPFFLMQEKRAPARELIDAGAVVALASDFNPGSSMTESMLFIIQLAVYTMKMGIEEVINAATANASYALARDDEIGSLEVGKKMDLILCEAPNYPSLIYHLGINPIKYVIKNGNIVVKEGRILRQ